MNLCSLDGKVEWLMYEPDQEMDALLDLTGRFSGRLGGQLVRVVYRKGAMIWRIPYLRAAIRILFSPSHTEKSGLPDAGSGWLVFAQGHFAAKHSKKGS